MKQYNRDRRLLIETYGETQGPSGETVEGWIPFGTYWAHFEQLRGREMWQAQQVTKDNQYRAVMLYGAETKAITQKMRAVLGSEMYDITAVIDIEGAHEYVELMLTEVV